MGGKRQKNEVKWGKYVNIGERSESSGGFGGGGGGWERAAEPEDMLLMPPFHDTRIWYHALICQMSSC